MEATGVVGRMRGLTPTERRCLESCASVERVEAVWDDLVTIVALRRLGRSAGSGGIEDATELGRLALRVCPLEDF